MQITFDLLRHRSKFPIYALCDEIVEVCASRTTWSGEPCAMHSGRHLLCIGRKEYVKLLCLEHPLILRYSHSNNFEASLVDDRLFFISGNYSSVSFDSQEIAPSRIAHPLDLNDS